MNMLFKNCNLISPDVELDGASILVENNMIRKIFAKGDALPQADKVIDVNGEMTVPGFVDVHVTENPALISATPRMKP